jgi:hypothetical protein
MSKRDDGTFPRSEFKFDSRRNVYICPPGKKLITTGHVSTDHAIRYIASVLNRPGLPEAVWFESGRHGWLFQHGVVAFLGFGRRDVAYGLQEPPFVEPSTHSRVANTKAT